MTNNELLLAISDMMDEKLEKGWQPIRSDIKGLKDDVDTLKMDVKGLKDDVDTLKTDVKELRSNMDILKDNVERLKNNVNMLNADMVIVKNEQARINLMIENEIRYDIRLLVENYLPAAKRYEKSNAWMEAMQSDINVMKGVLVEHSEILRNFA